MHRILKKSNEGGYTFIESISQLLITAMFLQLFLLFFFWKAPIEKQYSDYANLEWELFAVDLQQELSDVSEISIEGAGEIIRFRSGIRIIRIGKSGAVIRKQVNATGHVPILTNVQSVNFSIEGMMLSANVTMLDGTLQERGFVVGFYP